MGFFSDIIDGIGDAISDGVDNFKDTIDNAISDPTGTARDICESGILDAIAGSIAGNNSILKEEMPEQYKDGNFTAKDVIRSALEAGVIMATPVSDEEKAAMFTKVVIDDAKKSLGNSINDPNAQSIKEMIGPDPFVEGYRNTSTPVNTSNENSEGTNAMEPCTPLNIATHNGTTNMMPNYIDNPFAIAYKNTQQPINYIDRRTTINIIVTDESQLPQIEELIKNVNNGNNSYNPTTPNSTFIV